MGGGKFSLACSPDMLSGMKGVSIQIFERSTHNVMPFFFRKETVRALLNFSRDHRALKVETQIWNRPSNSKIKQTAWSFLALRAGVLPQVTTMSIDLMYCTWNKIRTIRSSELFPHHLRFLFSTTRRPLAGRNSVSIIKSNAVSARVMTDHW